MTAPVTGSTAHKWTNIRKSGYASVETGVTAFELMLQVYLLEFYVREFGLNPLLASAGAAIAVLWDAITDPLVGLVSDGRPTGRLGKRGGFILLGAIGFSISGIALFHPPDTSEQLILMAWYLTCYLAVNTSMSFVSVPHIAAVGDYANTSDERNSFFGWRLLFSNLGLLLGVTLPSQLSSSEGAGRAEASYWFAGALMLGVGLFLLSNRGIKIPTQAPKAISLRSFIKDLTGVFRNRFFVPLVIAFALAAIARAVNAGMALFYYKDVLLLDEKTQVSLILAVFILAIVGSIPIWLALSKHFWKKKPAIGGVFALGVFTCLTYPFFPAGGLLGPLFMAVVGGIAVGSVLLIESMVLDAVDAEQSSDTQRKDGAYFGCWKLAAKASRAGGVLLTGPLLVWTGYDADLAVQSDLTTSKIGGIFGYVVGAIFIASAIALAFNKLTPKSK
jgi:GPH family glycoside/pentoside/hexuronide:cation symporter